MEMFSQKHKVSVTWMAFLGVCTTGSPYPASHLPPQPMAVAWVQSSSDGGAPFSCAQEALKCVLKSKHLLPGHRGHTLTHQLLATVTTQLQ